MIASVRSCGTGKYLAMAVAALGLSGCFGGGGNGGGTTLDMGAVTGTGGAADPYVMPIVMPAGTKGGIDDYLAAAPGVWQFDSSSIYVGAGGNTITPPTISPTLKYDSAAGYWTFNIGGTEYVPNWNYSGAYTCGALGPACDAPPDTRIGLMYLGAGDFEENITRYGRFALISYELNTATDSSTAFLLSHIGLRTPVGGMPNTGSARYQGASKAVLHRGAGKQSPMGEGAVTITADFGSLTNTVGLSGLLFILAGGVTDGGQAIYSGGVATMTGTGTIEGNEFLGTVSTDLTGMAGAADTALTGTMAGAFYGPAADEVAGYFDTSGTVTTTSAGTEDVQFLGGFAAPAVTP
ncbi:MAG: transferrin-binding protein-like solute binding protein [Alphaproteobacteria bacterium]|nr:transferrin-binding protein-like solute binding protein [Alphaproteobacteria bacterium]